MDAKIEAQYSVRSLKLARSTYKPSFYDVDLTLGLTFLINLTLCTVVTPSLQARMKLPSWPITSQDMQIKHL